MMLANPGVRVINPALHTRLPYSTPRDFTPIARTAIPVNPKVPVNALKEFIDYGGARLVKASGPKLD